MTPAVIAAWAWVLSLLWLVAAACWFFFSSFPIMLVPCLFGAWVCAFIAWRFSGGRRARHR